MWIFKLLYLLKHSSVYLDIKSKNLISKYVKANFKDYMEMFCMGMFITFLMRRVSIELMLTLLYSPIKMLLAVLIKRILIKRIERSEH